MYGQALLQIRQIRQVEPLASDVDKDFALNRRSIHGHRLRPFCELDADVALLWPGAFRNSPALKSSSRASRNRSMD
jgi:hypothetical protein